MSGRKTILIPAGRPNGRSWKSLECYKRRIKRISRREVKWRYGLIGTIRTRIRAIYDEDEMDGDEQIIRFTDEIGDRESTEEF